MYIITVPCTSLGSVYLYSMTGGIWSLTQTLNGFSTDSAFGNALSYSSTGTQFAVGADGTNSYTGMYEMYDYMHIIVYIMHCILRYIYIFSPR